jgi:glycosyltransferase involved in cell wall biosynthesis
VTYVDAHPIRFSLIIPARDEEAYLPRLLDTVDEAQARYTGGPEAVEVIVADNVSTDGTAKIACERGCRVARVEKRVIAAVRNGGAAVARGEVLAFVDADTRIHPDTFNAIDFALATGKVVAGATGVRAERWSVGIAATFVVLVPLLWLTGLDTGVVFCRREDFDAIGGYNEELRVAEDVDFLWKLRRLGRTRRQRLARVTSVKAIACVRKFDKHGDWHYLTDMPRFLFRLLFKRGSHDEFVQAYWYDDER